MTSAIPSRRLMLDPIIDSDVKAWADAVRINGGQASGRRNELVSALVRAWKLSGAWALMDDAWLLVAENAPQALTSLKQRRLATAVNSPTFTVDRGYTYDGSTNYIATGFIPSTHAVAMTGTNMHISAYERTSATAGAVAGCFNSSTQAMRLFPRASSRLQVALNSQLTGSGGDTITDSRGLSAGSRNGTLAADILAYKNGVAVAPYTPGTLASTLPTQTLIIGAEMNNTPVAANFRAATVGFVSVGAAIPAGIQPAFYTAVQAFMVAVGANV